MRMEKTTMSDGPIAPVPIPVPSPAPVPEPQAKPSLRAAFISLIAQPVVQHAITAIATAVVATLLTYFGLKPAPIVVEIPAPSTVEPHAGPGGWVPPSEQETAAAINAIQAYQGMPAQFGKIAQDAINSDDGKPVFFWDAEKKVLGKTLGAWNQGGVGCCVSFGWGRGAQDLMLMQISDRSRELWPGHEVATEPIYGGSRVEIGGGRLRGDGSVGAWAAQWVQKYGILFRQKYDQYDLSVYSEVTARAWGKSGVPAVLDPIAREHAIKTVAMVLTSDELWAAIGNRYPVAVCSNVGYEGSPPASGVMPPKGQWNHCMEFCGRFEHPTLGKCFVVRNSWGNYLHNPITVAVKGGDSVVLPEGCFAITAASAQSMVSQKDSFAMSGFVGFPAKRVDWTSNKPFNARFNAQSIFALAP